jgi:hypothetical protein
MELSEVKQIKYSFDDDGNITVYVNGIDQKTEYNPNTEQYTVLID